VGKIYPVGANLYVVPGGGGNTAVFITSKSVLLVDTKYKDGLEALIAQVRTVTDKPITDVVNTHCHGDHTGGNAALPPEVTITVQEETAANMATMRQRFAPEAGPGHPVRTFKDKATLFDGDDAVDLYYFGPAHTNGDTFVVFRKDRVMHAGDVFSGKVAPIVNIEWGGDGRCYGEVIGKAAATIHGVDRVITGHGPEYSWSEFVDHGEFARILLERARAEMAAGHPPEEAMKHLDLPARFADYRLDRTLETLEEMYRSLRM